MLRIYSVAHAVVYPHRLLKLQSRAKCARQMRSVAPTRFVRPPFSPVANIWRLLRPSGCVLRSVPINVQRFCVAAKRLFESFCLSAARCY